MRQIYRTLFILLILTAVASAAAAGPIYLTAKVGNTSVDSGPGG